MTSAPAAARQTVADAAVGAGDHRELAGKIRNRYVGAVGLMVNTVGGQKAAKYPPSAMMVCPDMKLDRSEPSQTTVFAISCT